jgi:hypothetical protein
LPFRETYVYAIDKTDAALTVFSFTAGQTNIYFPDENHYGTLVNITYSGLTDPNTIAISGDYAYVTDANNGLVVFDISNPASPLRLVQLIPIYLLRLVLRSLAIMLTWLTLMVAL